MTRETDNLNRWRQSGEPERWVAGRQGRWGHQEWVALIEELRGSAFWPMHEADIGRTLEQAREQIEHQPDANPERPISPVCAALLHLLAGGDVSK